MNKFQFELERTMKPGEYRRISIHVFQELFPTHPLTNEPGIVRFLSGMIGSAWGRFEAWHDLQTGDVIVRRNAEPRADAPRIFWDWDRVPDEESRRQMMRRLAQ